MTNPNEQYNPKPEINIESLSTTMENRNWHNKTKSAVKSFFYCVKRIEDVIKAEKNKNDNLSTFYNYMDGILPNILEIINNIIVLNNDKKQELDSHSATLFYFTLNHTYLLLAIVFIILAALMISTIIFFKQDHVFLSIALSVIGYLMLTLSSVGVFVLYPSQPDTILRKAIKEIHYELELEKILNQLPCENFKKSIYDAKNLSAKECYDYAKMVKNNQKISSYNTFFHPERCFESKEITTQRASIEKELIIANNCVRMF